jgi:hypothetical protein
MKKIDVGQTITILANIGVIAGIGFLAIEIQQNTETLEMEMRFNQSERQTEVIEELIRNPHLAAAVAKAVNEEELTREEDLMLSALALRVFSSWSWQYDELQRGNIRVLNATEWRRVVHRWALGGYNYPLFANYWDSVKAAVSPGFRQWMEENVIQPGPP